MPEYRHDPRTGRMVIIAEERAARPHQFDIADTAADHIADHAAGRAAVCPFCEGNESQTPDEIDAFRSAGSPPDTPGWTVRTVPNKYPAVQSNELGGKLDNELGGEVNHDIPPALLDGSFLAAGGSAEGIGRHEVIIDTPRHVLSVTDLTVPETVGMLSMYRRRLAALRTDSRWAYVQIFKNVGAAAGASLPHSHSQLIAMPFAPPPMMRRRNTAEDTAEDRQCLECRMLNRERQRRERLVEETEHFVVLCPFVSRFAGEVEIYPKEHESAFEKTAADGLPELAEVLRRTVQRLEKAVFWMKGPLAYNIVLNTEPFQGDWSDVYHWHFSILPSLARAAGFEWGTGLHINPISPEQAAKRLREAV